MTREQYLELKSELKNTSSTLRSLKKQLRVDMSLQSRKLPYGDPICLQQGKVNGLKLDYRVKHIFMSLLRGKSREQIENNFLVQEPKNGLYSTREQKLKTLCDKYNLEYDQDESYKIISITRHWITDKNAA
jgi:hypothetical protein